MTSDYRVTPGLIHDILDALERHGYYRSDDQHADRAIGLIGDLARVYEGTQDYPAGAYLLPVPSSRPADPEPGGQAGQDAVTLADGDVSTVVAALDIAADYKRDRAEMCADCPDQSCPTCQSPLRDAQAYDRMAARHDPGRRSRPRRAAARADPEPQPAADRKQASDAPKPAWRRASRHGRSARSSRPPRGPTGTCRKPQNPTTCRSPTTGRQAAPST